jgi:hypothetical protein
MFQERPGSRVFEDARMEKEGGKAEERHGLWWWIICFWTEENVLVVGEARARSRRPAARKPGTELLKT